MKVILHVSVRSLVLVSFTRMIFILTTGGFMLQTDPNEKKRKRVRVDDSARLSSPTQRSTNPAYANLVPGDQVWLYFCADSVVKFVTRWNDVITALSILLKYHCFHRKCGFGIVQSWSGFDEDVVNPRLKPKRSRGSGCSGVFFPLWAL